MLLFGAIIGADVSGHSLASGPTLFEHFFGELWLRWSCFNETPPILLFFVTGIAFHALTHLPSFHLGVFFLFGAGRLALIRSQPHLAISYYTQAMHAQKQYRNLHYISYWEMAISYLALWDLSGSLGCWRVLEAEGNVSLLSFHLSVWIFRVFFFFFVSRYD